MRTWNKQFNSVTLDEYMRKGIAWLMYAKTV